MFDMWKLFPKINIHGPLWGIRIKTQTYYAGETEAEWLGLRASTLDSKRLGFC